MAFSTVANRDPKGSKLAIQRRLQKNHGGDKKDMSPMNGKGAGSMIPAPKKGGAYSSFVKDNFKGKKAFKFGK